MKKLLKQLLAVTTAIMMAITLLPAMANAENAEQAEGNKYGAEDTFVVKPGRITVNKTTQDSKTPLEGAGFTVYTALTFKKDSKGKIVVDPENNHTDETIPDVNTADFKKIIGSFTSAKQVAEKYGKYVAKPEQFTESNGETVFENLNPGIYIVAETTVPTAKDTTYYESVPFIVSLPSTSGKDGNNNDIGSFEEAGTKWIYDITATPKNNAAFGEKKITGVNSQKGKNPGTVDDKGTTASANIGDTVAYEITATSPTKGSDKFNVTDKIKGLEVNKNSIVVKAGERELTKGKDKDYTVEDIAAPDKGFKVAFSTEWIEANPNTRITISYSATVTADAKIGTDANTNTAIIDFGQEKSQETNTPKVYTYGFTLTKQGENETLDGVIFELYKEDKTTKIDTQTTNNGSATFDGLAAGTYYLKETKTASGYTLLANPIEIKISAPAADTPATFTYDNNKAQLSSKDKNGNARFTFTVTNKKGFNLPSTGGMGTYIFTIGGLVVMAGAVLLLVSSKKKRA